MALNACVAEPLEPAPGENVGTVSQPLTVVTRAIAACGERLLCWDPPNADPTSPTYAADNQASCAAESKMYACDGEIVCATDSYMQPGQGEILCCDADWQDAQSEFEIALQWSEFTAQNAGMAESSCTNIAALVYGSLASKFHHWVVTKWRWPQANAVEGVIGLTAIFQHSAVVMFRVDGLNAGNPMDGWVLDQWNHYLAPEADPVYHKSSSLGGYAYDTDIDEALDTKEWKNLCEPRALPPVCTVGPETPPPSMPSPPVPPSESFGLPKPPPD